MEHVVFFPGPDAPGFRRFASRDEAVRFVEQLRNVDGVSDVSLYAMTPVPLVVRTYYRVEVPAVDDAVLPTVPEQAAPGHGAAEPVSDRQLPEPAAAVDDAESADGRLGADAAVADARSLGFFAH